MYTEINFDYSSTPEYNRLCEQVKELVGKNPRFEFSIIQAAESDSGFYVNHPDLQSEKPAIKGRVELYADYWRISETGKVVAPILEDPTWQDILAATNRLLEKNNAGGIFLETLRVTGQSDEALQVELVFGS